METNVILMNLTDQGVKNIKEFRGRYDMMVKAIEDAGGKVKGFYSCMGPYDYVMIIEGVSAEEIRARVCKHNPRLPDCATETAPESGKTSP